VRPARSRRRRALGLFLMVIEYVRCYLRSLPLACSRPVAAELKRIGGKPRTSFNAKASLFAYAVPNLAGGTKNTSRPTQCAAVDLRRRPPP
jgi:hypothetical protein